MAQGQRVANIFVNLQAQTAQFTRGMASATKSMNKLKLAAAAGTAAVAVGIGKSVKTFADFDDAMQQSRAIMGDLTQKEMQDMEAAARQVARTTTTSAKEAAESFFFLASAGLDARQSVEALPAVAEFAQAGMFSMARATDLATDAQSALGLKSQDAQKNLKNLTRVTDVLVKANTLANATVEQFSESLTNKLGARLRSVNKDIEEGAAALAVLADQGVKGRRAGSGLNIVLRDLQSTAVRNAEQFRELGIRVFDSAGEMRNIADIVADFERAMGSASTEQKAMQMEFLGINRRAQDFLQLLLGNSEAIRDYERGLDSAGGTAGKVADKQLQTLNKQLELLKSQFIDVALAIGKRFIPKAQDAVSSMRDLVGDTDEAVSALERFADVVKVIAFGAIAGSVIPKLGKLSGLFTSFGALVTIVFGNLKNLGGVFSFLGAEIAALATKILPKLAGVMRVLGGPAGVVATVVFALHEFTNNIDDTIRPTANLTEHLDELKDTLDELTEAELRATEANLKRQIAQQVEFVQAQRRKLQEAAQKDVGGGRLGLGTQAAQQTAEIQQRLNQAEADLQNLLNTLSAVRSESNKTWDLFIGGTKDSTESTTELSEASTDAAESLQSFLRETMTLRDTLKIFHDQTVDDVIEKFQEAEEETEKLGEVNEELAKKVEGVVSVNGELVDINRAVRGGTDDAADSTSDLARELERAARTGIDFARTLGLIGDSAAATLNSVANLGIGVKDLIDAIGSGGFKGIVSAGAGILGAIGGIVSGLFGGGGDSDEQRRRRQELNQLNQQLERTLALLTASAKKLDAVAVSLAERGLTDEFKDLAREFRNVGDELTNLELRNLRDQLHRLGLSVADVRDLARQFGLQVDELISILATGEGDMEKAALQLGALAKAILQLPDASEAARRSIDALNERLRDMRNDIDRFDIDDPLKKVQKMLEVLASSAFGGSEGETVTVGGDTFEIGGRTITIPEREITTQEPQDPGPLFNLLQQLQNLDLGVLDVRKQAVGMINELITGLQAKGQILPDATEDFEEQVEDQLIQLIKFIRDIPEKTAPPEDEETDRTGAGGGGGGFTPPTAPGPPEVSRPGFLRRASISAPQASELISIDRENLIRNEQQVMLQREMVRLLSRLPTGIRDKMDLAISEELNLEQTAA